MMAPLVYYQRSLFYWEQEHMTIFVTSDLHFSHARICEFTDRPWAAEENNEKLIELWNSQVGPKDTVYHLGDFIFAGPKRQQEAFDILIRLNGHKYMLYGNHCHINMWNILQSRPDWYKANVTHLGHYHELKMERKTVCMMHYPILNFNKQEYGSFMLHGHTHGNLPFDPTVRRLDVGLDAHPELRFYTWDEIKDIMKEIPWPRMNHHGGENEARRK